jgi:PKD repeat protein
MRAIKFFAALLLVGTVASGCLDDSITGTRAVTLTILVDVQSAAVGESVTVSYDATGTSIASVIVDWGDGEQTPVEFDIRPVEATGAVEHAYSDAGSYTITGTVNASNGVVTSEATVGIS